MLEEYTIEHILTQNPVHSAAWQQSLGDDWQKVQQKWLNTLGNPTLTRYNYEYSDRAFAEKREIEGGFAMSPVRLNTGLGQPNEWTEATIQARAGRLADQALTVWRALWLDAAALTDYQPKKSASRRGTDIQNYPNLLNPQFSGVFDAFRQQVLALSPCISEECLR